MTIYPLVLKDIWVLGVYDYLSLINTRALYYCSSSFNCFRSKLLLIKINIIVHYHYFYLLLSIPCPEIGCQLIKLIDLFDPHGIKKLYGKV